MNIGKGIKVVLERKGLSQKELSEKTGLSETSLSLMLQGKKQPRAENVKKISKALKVRPEIFFYLSLDIQDVPVEKRERFKLIWPTIEMSVIGLFSDDVKD